MSTPHQHLHIRTLLYELDISTAVVGDDLLRCCEAAGIKNLRHQRSGERVDSLLDELSSEQAKALVQELLTGEGAA